MARISLEDNFTDIIGKAQRGLGYGDAELAERAGIRVEEVSRIKAGTINEPVIRQVARALELHPEALVGSARGAWYPNPVQLDGLSQFTTAYYDMTVNAYVAWDTKDKEAAVFDTGADSRPILEFAHSNQLAVKFIFLTHSHGDHIADLERLQRETKAPAYISENEPVRRAERFTEGRTFSVGSLRIEARQTSGHSAGGTTYVVSGLARLVAVVGDAMFAGSMGGGMVSYKDALKNNRQKILTLPGETIICPGHGPLTSVEEEKNHNPFFPEFKR